MVNWKDVEYCEANLQRRRRSELKAASDDETRIEAVTSYYRNSGELGTEVYSHPSFTRAQKQGWPAQWFGLGTARPAGHRPRQRDDKLCVALRAT